MKRKAYISGKVTGLPIDEVRAKFHKKEMQLMAEGYDLIFNPVTFIEEMPDAVFREMFNDPKHDYRAQMRCCIHGLMTCNEIHLLPCWQDSKGAQIEVETSLTMGIKIFYPAVKKNKS